MANKGRGDVSEDHGRVPGLAFVTGAGREGLARGARVRKRSRTGSRGCSQDGKRVERRDHEKGVVSIYIV